MFFPNHPLAPTALRRRFILTAGLCCTAVIAVASTVLIGWTLHIVRLTQIRRDLVAMNPLSAVSFILCATSLLLVLRYPIKRLPKIIALALCTPIVLFGISQLITAFNPRIDLAWDQWMFRQSLNGNRVAPNTTACLVLIALAISLIDIEWIWRIRPAQSLALIAGAIASVALIGYLYNTIALYDMPTFIPMALHSGICGLTLCFAILCARPGSGVMAVVTGDDLGGMLARRLLSMTIVAPILFGWLRLVVVRHGLMSDQLSNAVLVMAVTGLFSSLVWTNSRVLRRIDAERRRAEVDMRQAEQRYRAVVQQTAEGIYLLDATTKRVIESNAAFRRILGYSAAEMDQLMVYDLVHHSRESVDHRLAETLAAGHAVMGERQYKRRDGSAVDVQANASVITYDGKAVLCTVVHDITRRKTAEREIQQKNQQLEEAFAELKRTQSQLVQNEKLVGLGQMVAGVAHEINNPLSFVSNNVAVLQRDLAGIRKLLEFYQQADAIIEANNKSLMDEIRDLSERIDLPYTLKNSDDLMARSREGLRRIQQIVKDLREFARLDESDLQEADLNDGIASTVNIIKGTGKKNQVEIEMDLKPLPLFSCYPAKVNQVVMNLLSNAIDASAENSKVIVSSRCTEKGDIEIQVQDQGSGIPPEIISRIFDPFYTTKPIGKGTGLGLSISYGIVQDHGGTIEVESSVGKGTCFTVRLPKRKTDAK